MKSQFQLKIITVYLLLHISGCHSNARSLPKIFALKIIGTKNYVSLAFDDTSDLVVRNYEVEIPELFEQVLAPTEFSPGTNTNYYTIICIRSVFNERFFKIDANNRHIVKANEYDVKKASQFMVYFGPGKNIGLKSLSSGRFLQPANIDNDTLLIAGSGDSPEAGMLFEHEYFEAPVDYPIYDDQLDNRPEIKMGPLEKLKLPMNFALKVNSVGYNIGVDKNTPHTLFAKTNFNDDWQTFQVLYFPEIHGGIDDEKHPMLICLKSAANNMYVSARDQVDFRLVLKADSVNCSVSEKFELHYGPRNTVSLRSRLNQKFLGASDNLEEPLAFDKNQFDSLEIIKVFDKSHFPRFFALQSIANGRFLKIESDNSSTPLKTDSFNENDAVIFMYVLFAQPNEDAGQNETVISIQSKLTNNVLSVRGGKELVTDNTEQIGDNQKWLVYHGPNDIIGLKSLGNGRFIGADSDMNLPLTVNRNEFGLREMFKVIEVMEKYSFPKLFSLKARSNENFIHIEASGKALKANSDACYERTAFEAIVYPGSDKLDDKFIISLRSLVNGKLLSSRKEQIFDDATSLSDNEKFYVYYSFNNVIGLKSKATGKYLSSNPSTDKPLELDRDYFKEWEMFEIVPYY